MVAGQVQWRQRGRGVVVVAIPVSLGVDVELRYPSGAILSRRVTGRKITPAR